MISSFFVGVVVGLLLDLALTHGVLAFYKRRLSTLEKRVQDWQQLANDWKNLNRSVQKDFVEMNGRWRRLLDETNAAWKKLIRENFGVEAEEPPSEKEKFQ